MFGGPFSNKQLNMYQERAPICNLLVADGRPSRPLYYSVGASTVNVPVIAKHNLEILDAVWITVAFAFERFLDDGGLPLLNLQDTPFDSPGNLRAT